jgi:hypothetical protein
MWVALDIQAIGGVIWNGAARTTLPEPDSTRPTEILSMPLLTEAPAEEAGEEEGSVKRAGRDRREF